MSGTRTSVKTLTAHVPSRAALIDGPKSSKKLIYIETERYYDFLIKGMFKKPAGLVPPKSQGMKATLKLLKRPRR